MFHVRLGSMLALTMWVGSACAPPAPDDSHPTAESGASLVDSTYTTVRLTADLDHLTGDQRQMLLHLIAAAEAMDEAFWLQAYGPPGELLMSIEDPGLRRYAEINYGPWDRLADNEPFIPGVGPKPLGARFYPEDMSKEEFEAAAVGEAAEALESQYSIVRRDADGGLVAVPYSRAFPAQIAAAAAELDRAATLAKDPGFKRYLALRAEALRTDEYYESDLAWMDMRDNAIDVVIGPIENYEDKLFGYKTSFEAYVLIKDREWSDRLSRYAAMLPELQRGIPVPDAYKREQPGANSQLNAYDVIYYAGDCNAGSKTIAINLPNDERVQLAKGSRRLQLKNAMRAKFDRILVPIAEVLVVEDQRDHVTFDAFFSNTMFHEVAHGLGIKNTITDRGPVRTALKDLAGAVEEGKADILGLYMVTALHDQGLLEGDLEDFYVTFMASIFRSVRFGASSAHGKANMVRFNFFEEHGAFSRSPEGEYRVDFDRMREAIGALSEKLLRLQGDGDYEVTKAFVDETGQVGEGLARDLRRVDEAGIPVDIVFEQGLEL